MRRTNHFCGALSGSQDRAKIFLDTVWVMILYILPLTFKLPPTYSILRVSVCCSFHIENKL